MPKRLAEAPPSSETLRVRHADSFGSYRSQVAEFLSQEERISLHDLQATVRHSNTAIGAGMSNLNKEKLNVLLRQCVKNLTPEIDEMQQRVCRMHLISQMANNCASSSPSILQSIVVPDESGGATEDDIQNLVSDLDLVKRLMSQDSHALLSELENMQQELENLLDDVVATCRPMTHGEKRDLQKSIKELPEGNLHRIAEIVANHCIRSGKEFFDEVIVNLEQSDNIMLWRLHFYVGAVKNARKLGR
ncbi:hypothetical protein EUTSA_v10004828mg [Eutrema salsugineum]|uniref:NET domain-containing protein n=1 Tax=Eutrema salsugineum TaxID=72664 RepID=V4KN74_EUTSA|nr:uncharacterized protein LOC18013431 isoform X2 [Eutrema salsugineum]ESQ32729.1 hypothetical protein EUTSA_v10004828mg [Eutrema salsugineum]